ncbi:MAG: repressor LexA [Bdellovibrionales bacterium GWA2_49_15]|nr:MAG: repressor LexA [Bdellovibrionales bacterium GWA2_49_15]
MGLTKKQMDVYQFISDYLEKNGRAPTQKEIKDHFGLKSFGSVQRYIQYLANAGLLETDWNARCGIKVQNAPAPEHHSQLRSQSHSQSDEEESEGFIPLLGNVAAGNPILAIEQADQTIQVPKSLLKGRHRFYALRVKGDSMIEDGILDRDVAIVRYQEEAQNGQTVVAIVDGEATLKHYHKSGAKIELRPANARYSPIVVESTSSHHPQFKLAGILVGIFRSLQ